MLKGIIYLTLFFLCHLYALPIEGEEILSFYVTDTLYLMNVQLLSILFYIILGSIKKGKSIFLVLLFGTFLFLPKSILVFQKHHLAMFVSILLLMGIGWFIFQFQSKKVIQMVEE